MRLTLLLLSPLLLLLVLFALSNTAPVPIGLWPTGLSIEVPLSAAILTAMALAFLLGAFTTWLAGLAHRRRARRAERQARELQAELDRLRQQLAAAAQPALLPPR